MRRVFLVPVVSLVLGIAGIVSLSGCESRPPLEELGDLEFDVPNLPGIDEPYPFPWGTENSKSSAKGIGEEGPSR